MEPTREGELLIQEWQDAKRRLEAAKNEMNRAECSLNNSITKLGRWLSPDDAKTGEKFCVWFGDSLIESTKISEGNFSVLVRKRGKSLM